MDHIKLVEEIQKHPLPFRFWFDAHDLYSAVTVAAEIGRQHLLSYIAKIDATELHRAQVRGGS